MPAKKKTAPASTPAHEHRARLAYAKLTALAGTAVRLTRDVENPCVDRRVRWSAGLDAAPAVIPAGVLVAVEGSAADGRFTLRFGDWQVAWLSCRSNLGFAGAPYALPGGGSGAERRVARDLLDALGEPERTWEALCARRDEGRAKKMEERLAAWAWRGEAIDYSSWERAALRHLVASGRLTLEEVEAASIAAEAENED